MRLVIPAIAAALALTVGTASFAASKQQRGSQNGTQSYAKSDSYNKCVALAKARGYARSDIEDNIGGARRFVQSCMRGKQQ